MLFIVPPQVYVERLYFGQFTGSYLQFWPAEAFIGSYPEGNISWHHLWFLPYLLIYSVVLSPLFLYIRRHPDNNLSTLLRRCLQKPLGWYVFAALVLSKSSVRAIDIFGTQALARAPYLIASFTGFTGVLETFSKFLLWITTNTGNPVEITGAQILFAVLLLILTMVLTVWLVALMFNAFKVSSNLKGAKLIVSFIVILLISIGIMLKITFMIVPHNTALI